MTPYYGTEDTTVDAVCWLLRDRWYIKEHIHSPDARIQGNDSRGFRIQYAPSRRLHAAFGGRLNAEQSRPCRSKRMRPKGVPVNTPLVSTITRRTLLSSGVTFATLLSQKTEPRHAYFEQVMSLVQSWAKKEYRTGYEPRLALAKKKGNR